MILTTPLVIPCIRPFTLYWDSKTTFEVRPGALQQATAICSESLHFMQDIMHTLLRSTHSDQRPDNRKDFVTLFTPNINEQQFEMWLSVNRGRRLALEEFYLNRETTPRGLVRSSLYFGVPHVFHRWRTTSSDGAETEVEVECFSLPKRRNFLEAGTLSEKSTDLTRGEWSGNLLGEARSFPAKSCTIDFLPIEHAQFSLFHPGDHATYRSASGSRSTMPNNFQECSVPGYPSRGYSYQCVFNPVGYQLSAIRVSGGHNIEIHCLNPTFRRSRELARGLSLRR